MRMLVKLKKRLRKFLKRPRKSRQFQLQLKTSYKKHKKPLKKEMLQMLMKN